MKKELQLTIAAVLFAASETLSASVIAREVEVNYKTVYDVLNKMMELSLVEKLDDKTYHLTDYGIAEFKLFKTSLPPEPKEVSGAKPKYKALSEIKIVKSVLEQIEESPKVDEIEVRPYPFVTDSAIEDFETRAKPISEAEESVAASFDDVSPELKAFIEQGKLDASLPSKHFFSELDDDSVFSPQHYNQGGIECIEALQSCMSESEYQGFLRGNAIKYLWRLNDKATPQENLKKARWYIDTLTESFL